MMLVPGMSKDCSSAVGREGVGLEAEWVEGFPHVDVYAEREREMQRDSRC